jgi:MoaA/NifB/PqqE/SkfB family radical SAM enzyme
MPELKKPECEGKNELRPRTSAGFFSVSNIYRAGVKLYTAIPYRFARSGWAFPARHYFMEVTRRCNLRCVMCQYVNWLRDTPVSEQKQGELTCEEWSRVIDQVQRFSLITFTGGEPFTRDDFMDLLARASKRTRTHLISNAVLLTEERARECVGLAPKRAGGAGFNFAGVSIEGPEETHDKLRGLRGGFERSMTGVRALAAYRDAAGKKCPMIHLTTVIQAGNVDVLRYMPEIAVKAGCNVMNLTLEARNWELPGMGEVNPATFDPDAMEFPRIDAKKLTQALEDTREAARRVGIDLRTPDMPDSAIVDYYQGKMDLSAFRCGGAWTNLTISAKGDAYPSCWLSRIGNVREQSLREIWNGTRARAFRRATRKKLHPPCVGCCVLTRND